MGAGGVDLLQSYRLRSQQVRTTSAGADHAFMEGSWARFLVQVESLIREIDHELDTMAKDMGITRSRVTPVARYFEITKGMSDSGRSDSADGGDGNNRVPYISPLRPRPRRARKSFQAHCDGTSRTGSSSERIAQSPQPEENTPPMPKLRRYQTLNIPRKREPLLSMFDIRYMNATPGSDTQDYDPFEHAARRVDSGAIMHKSRTDAVERNETDVQVDKTNHPTRQPSRRFFSFPGRIETPSKKPRRVRMTITFPSRVLANT